MALEGKDIEALQLLISEEIRSQLQPMEQRLAKRFDEVNDTLERLAAGDEKREQEYLSLNEQIKRHDKRIDILERKVASRPM